MSDYETGEHHAEFYRMVKQGHALFVNDAEQPILSESLLDLLGLTAERWEKMRSYQREREKYVVEKGDPAPNFDLPYLRGTNCGFRLSSLLGQRPVGLIFGSYT